VSSLESSRVLKTESDSESRASGSKGKGAEGAAGKPTEGAATKPTRGGMAKAKAAGGNRRTLRIAVVGVAIVVAVIAWVATRDSGGGSAEPASTEAAAPRIVTPAQLSEAAATLGQPIYWAGPRKGQELVLKELGAGGVQVLYAPEGTVAAKVSRGSLTIGSYPLPNPRESVEGFAERPGSTSRQASDGRELARSGAAPTSVYFASSDNSVQVEVYDPSAKRAMSLALSGKVEPAG